MLSWVTGVCHHRGAIWVSKLTFNVLPKVVEVHDLVVFEFLLIELHLLVMDLLLA